MKWATLIMLLAVFAMPAVADDVDTWIQNLNDTNQFVREPSADDLGNRGDTRAVEPLILALKDDESHSVRDRAARALGKLKDTRAVEPLILALKDENSSVREGAAWALGELNDTRAVEPLILALKDEDSDARETAALALKELNDTRAIEPLILALKDGDSDVRETAAVALGKLKDTRAVGPLIQALTDEDSDVREATAWALGKLKDTRAVEPLKSALNDEDENVRTYAAEALGELNDTKAMESQSHPDPVPSVNSDKAQSPQNETLNTSGALRLSDMNEMQLYENVQYGFGMSHPINWIVQEPDANDQGIVVGFLAPGEDVNSPATYLLVQIEKLPSGQKITLEQYGQAVQRNLKVAAPDLKILTESDISIGGQPGHAIVYNLASQDVTFRVLKAWTLREENAYAFTYNAPDDRYDEFAGDISKMIGSLSAA